MKKKSAEGKKRDILPGAMLIALVAAVIVFFAMLNAERNVLQSYEKGTVWVASEEIVRGMKVTEENVGSLFVSKEMDKSLIPEKAVTDISTLIGKYAYGTSDVGAVITESMFADAEKFSEGLANPALAGLSASDLYEVVGGVLRAGDKVNIYAIDFDSMNNESEVVLRWEGVYVAEVFDSSGNSIEGSDTVTPAQRLNIWLEESQVEDFYSQLARGSLRVVRVVD